MSTEFWVCLILFNFVCLIIVLYMAWKAPLMDDEGNYLTDDEGNE